jgi:hypothetical protein
MGRKRDLDWRGFEEKSRWWVPPVGDLRRGRVEKGHLWSDFYSRSAFLHAVELTWHSGYLNKISIGSARWDSISMCVRHPGPVQEAWRTL